MAGPLDWLDALVAKFRNRLTTALALAGLGLEGLKLAGRADAGLSLQVLAAALAALLLLLVGLIPFVGGLVTLSVLLLGMGAVGLELAQAYGRRARAGAAP